MQLDANFLANDNMTECMNLEENGLAFTGAVNRQIVASAGIKRIWGNVGEGWVLATYDIWNHPITIARAIKKNFEELAKGTEKQKIYPLILKEVGFPTFLTLITTVVGFLSLLFSSIKPIKDFGIYTSVGIIIAFCLSYTLLPALLYFFTPKKLVSVHTHDNKTYNVMRSILFWIFRNQKTIVITSCLLVALSIFGAYQIKVNNILLEDLSDNVKIKQDFKFFDKHYSGARPLEFAVQIKNKNKTVWDYDIMKQLNSVDEFIKKEYHAGFMYSPAMLAKNINKALIDQTSGESSFPNQEDYEAVKKQLIENKKNKDIKTISKYKIKSASNLGQPFISLFQKRANFKVFLRIQNTITAKNTKQAKTSNVPIKKP